MTKSTCYKRVHLHRNSPLLIHFTGLQLVLQYKKDFVPFFFFNITHIISTDILTIVVTFVQKFKTNKMAEKIPSCFRLKTCLSVTFLPHLLTAPSTAQIVKQFLCNKTLSKHFSDSLNK